MALRSFWALPAILRLIVCDHVAFSVHNDLLAFPQVSCYIHEKESTRTFSLHIHTDGDHS